jgi:hypothetical protein
MIQQWQAATPTYYLGHTGLFRLLDTSPRAVCVTDYAAGFSIIERNFDIIIVPNYGRRTYGAVPHKAIPVSRYQLV